MAMLASIEARELRIPFRQKFAHASATRASAEGLWVEARGDDGTIGQGEGCPREYVTGETLEGALDFVSERRAALISEIRDFESLECWVAEHRADIDAHPAAWCAIELALLDLLGKRSGETFEALLGWPPISGEFRYTAVLGDGPRAQFDAQLATYRGAGFRDFKIKLSLDSERNRAKVSALRAAGVGASHARADANNLWTDPDAAIRSLAALDYPFHAIEEPLRAGDFAGLRQISDALDCAIIVDESVLATRDIARASDALPRGIVNVRVSKMGGLLRSIECIRAIRDAGLRAIVGAHVGETSLLTRAALTVASAARDILVAQEGAFGTLLLERDIVDPPLAFGAGGVLEASAIPRGPGSGFAKATFWEASEAPEGTQP
jgi:L-alanine-DL-glutamate epimerase-like enolase superfamily enzyme